MLSARLRQIVTAAPSDPKASNQRSVGRCDVTIDEDNGAIGRGAGTGQVHPVAPRVQPVLHDAPHVLAMHVAVPPEGTGHTIPHPPQFDTFVVVFTHAPLHRVYPALHDSPHAPEVHVADPFVVDAHAVQEEPQWLASFSAKQLEPHAW
jgi:hypothetical protein